jgi:hypothetical protein
MIGRPCKPDPDLNWLWRTLLPDTPVPACDSGQKHDPASETIEGAVRGRASRPKDHGCVNCCRYGLDPN